MIGYNHRACPVVKSEFHTVVFCTGLGKTQHYHLSDFCKADTRDHEFVVYDFAAEQIVAE